MILIILVFIAIYFLYRNNKVYIFLTFITQIKHIYVNTVFINNVEKVYKNPYSYEKLLFSFKPLKLKYWKKFKMLEEYRTNNNSYLIDKIK